MKSLNFDSYIHDGFENTKIHKDQLYDSLLICSKFGCHIINMVPSYEHLRLDVKHC